MCFPSLCFERFWVLLVHFVLCSSNSRKPSKIFIWIFVYLSFSKYKVTAVVTNEIEHTVINTLVYVYAYLCASWFIFIFKNAIIPIIGCNNIDYLGSLLFKRNIYIYIYILYIYNNVYNNCVYMNISYIYVFIYLHFIKSISFYNVL